MSDPKPKNPNGDLKNGFPVTEEIKTEPFIQPSGFKSSETFTKVAAKLMTIAEEIPPIERDGTNTFHNYNYVSASAMMQKIRPTFFKNKVFVIPRFNILESGEIVRKDGKVDLRIVIYCTIRVVDTESGEWLEVNAPGDGVDPGDKACAKGMTLSLKYALMHLLMISGVDDPEGDGRTDQNHDGPKPQQRRAQQPAQGQGQPPAQTTSGGKPSNVWTDWKPNCPKCGVAMDTNYRGKFHVASNGVQFARCVHGCKNETGGRLCYFANHDKNHPMNTKKKGQSNGPKTTDRGRTDGGGSADYSDKDVTW